MTHDPKKISTCAYPLFASETSGLMDEVAPLYNAKDIIAYYLNGINLGTVTEKVINHKIKIAIANLELLLKVPIVAKKYKERMAFDKDAYKAHIFLKTVHKPILELESLSVETTDGLNIFELPPAWIESGRFLRGQINVIPFLANYSANALAGFTGEAGLIFLMGMGAAHWIPSYWTVVYTAGLCKNLGQVPLIVNNLIGIETALMILSMLGPTREFNSVSLSQDGISQSTSGPGNALYAQRRQELEEEKQRYIEAIKGLYGTKFQVFDF